MNALAVAPKLTSTTQTPPLPPLASPVPDPPTGVSVATVATNQAALDAHQVVSAAQNTFGNNYAGMWVDNSGNPSILHIMVAGSKNAATESTFMSSIPATAQATTQIGYVKYTYSQLEGFKNKLVQYATSHFTISGDTPSSSMIFSIDTIDNAVNVGLSEQDIAFLSPLQALVPSDAIRISWISGSFELTNGPGFESGVGRGTFPPYMAGLEIHNYTPSVSIECTSGFLLEANGVDYGVTAGHCAGPNNFIMGSNTMTQVGTPTGIQSNGSGGDYDVFKLTSYKQPPQGQILAEVINGKGFVDNVIGREADKYQGIGLVVCSAGVTTNAVTCGSIYYAAGATVFYNYTFYGNEACAFFALHPGNSGGPVYVPYPRNEGTAAGVNGGTLPDISLSCYTTIDKVLQGITNHIHKPAYVVDANGNLS